MVTQNNSEIVSVDSKDILKRQATPPTQMVFVYVDVNILPADITSQSIGKAFDVSTHTHTHMYKRSTL